MNIVLHMIRIDADYNGVGHTVTATETFDSSTPVIELIKCIKRYANYGSKGLSMGTHTVAATLHLPLLEQGDLNTLLKAQEEE